jgi:hypothetical protein
MNPAASASAHQSAARRPLATWGGGVRSVEVIESYGRVWVVLDEYRQRYIIAPFCELHKIRPGIGAVARD